MPRPPKVTDSCPVPESTVTPDSTGPFKPIPKCDPPLTPTPQVFSPIVPAPAVGPAVPSLPDPIEFQSPERTATCAQWPAYTEGNAPLGNDVVIPEGAFTESLIIQNLNVARQDLYYIAQIVATELALVRSMLEACDVDGLALLFNVSKATSTTIIAEVLAIQARLTAQAEAAALAGLSCWWYNVEQIATCPEGASTELGTNPSVVLADQFTSQLSQADADAQALALAEAGLECFYVNDEVVLVCSDVDPSKVDLDPGNTTQEAGSSAAANPGRAFSNLATVEAGVFVSELNKADANLQARNYALTLVDCFYIQPTEVKETCSPDEDDIPAMLHTVTYDGATQGNPVTVPAGYTLSEISFADTLQQASDLAVSSLECQWGNMPLRYSCDDAESDTTDPAQVLSHTENYFTPCNLGQKEPPDIFMNALGGDVWFYAIPSKSATYTVLVEKEEFISQIGTRDANSLAATYAISQLSCTYCNPHLQSSCNIHASNYTLRVTGIAYAKDTGDGKWKPSVDICSLPSSAVATFCGLDPWNVAAQADALGSRAYKDIISAESDCVFDNDDTYVACQQEVAVTAPATWLWENPETGLSEATPTARGWKIAAGLGPLGTGHTSGLVFIPHGTFSAPTRDEANELAVAMGLSQLDCYWDNDEKIKNCEELDSSTMLSGVTSTYTVPAHTLTSYVSKAEANAQATLLAESMLTCIYCSDLVATTTCPFVSLPPCASVSGLSSDDATNTALALLESIVSVIQDCGSGSSGGSGGSGGGGGGGGGSTSSGSNKSTAIVPASWEPGGFTALYIHEMPEVRFDDVVRIDMRAAIVRHEMDFRFVEVCESGTIVVDSAIGDTNPIRCARVEGNQIVVEAAETAWPASVVVRVSGIRKGFAGMRFGSRTREQFLANEAFINSAYPA